MARCRRPVRLRSHQGARIERPAWLLVIDDRALANTVDLTLRHGRHLRRLAGAVDEAKSAIADWRPQLLVVDIDIEAGRGIQLIDLRPQPR
jgi:response regulator of citrate/malate metabolism